MDVKCFPLAGEQNYTVEDFQSYLGTRIPGVYSDDTNLAVTAQASPDMSVKVSSGLAWLQAADLRGIVFPMTEAVDLTIETADALQARIDTVVIGLDKTRRTGYLKVVKGLPGGGATAPVRDGNYFELVLAEITVRPATSAIISADISDQRADEAVCGLMRDGVQSIPSATFQAQAEQIILEMRVAIADALADSGIIDNLTTADAFKALSANMGKKLQDEKAPKASPTFTGTATIPTAAVTTLNAGTANANAVFSPSFVGMVAFFAGTATPAGWLKCDGTVKNKTTYANLFAFIGTTYNTGGEHSDEFRVPNLCDGSFIRGIGGNAAALGVKQGFAMQIITGAINCISESFNRSGSASGAFVKLNGYSAVGTPKESDTSDASAATFDSSRVAQTANETRPLNTAMTPYIKY